MEKVENLSAYLRDMLEGGNGYSLDCFLQARNPNLLPWQEKVLSISRKYSTEEFPVGISNPSARSELWSLVSALDREFPPAVGNP